MAKQIKERQDLINAFQKWLDTNPHPKLIASECASIAEQYNKSKNVDLIDKIICMYAPDGNPDIWLHKILELRDDITS